MSTCNVLSRCLYGHHLLSSSSGVVIILYAESTLPAVKYHSCQIQKSSQGLSMLPRNRTANLPSNSVQMTAISHMVTGLVISSLQIQSMWFTSKTWLLSTLQNRRFKFTTTVLFFACSLYPNIRTSCTYIRRKLQEVEEFVFFMRWGKRFINRCCSIQYWMRWHKS